GLWAGYNAPVIGNGVGAWSGFTGPFGGTEAHNSFIDWFSIAGGLGLLLWLQTIVRFMMRFRLTNPAPQINFLGLLIFSFFHFVFRHPFFWFAMCQCMLACPEPLRLRKPREAVFRDRQQT